MTDIINDNENKEIPKGIGTGDSSLSKVTGSTENSIGKIMQTTGGINKMHVNAEEIAKKLQEKINKDYLVTLSEYKGNQVISIDEPKDALRKKYGEEVLKQKAADFARDKRYAGKTRDEILEFYFTKVATPQIEIVFDAGDTVHVKLSHYKQLVDPGHRGTLLVEELESELPNLEHFLKTGDFLPSGKMQKEKGIYTDYNYDDFDPDGYTSWSAIEGIDKISAELQKTAQDLQKLIKSGNDMSVLAKSPEQDFERILINKLGTPQKEIAIAIVGDQMNMTIAPNNADYRYSGSFTTAELDKVASNINQFLYTGECAENYGMKQEKNG